MRISKRTNCTHKRKIRDYLEVTGTLQLITKAQGPKENNFE